ncbi:MAG: MerR family transcriptional regulator [Chloroflexota bacterium]
MYTIKQAATRTGLSVTTIRAWERRYGVVSPARTTAGYRLYDEGAIERLAAMRSLVESEGWRPSQAAQRVATPGLDLAALADRVLSAAPDRVAGAREARRDDPVSAFVAAAKRLDVDAMESVLDAAFAEQRFELAMETVVFPSLRAVGDAWADRELDVAAEHAASETVRRRLARFFAAARGPVVEPRLLVGMPPGGRHDLGAFAFAVACLRAGEAVAYVGADVPAASWLRIATETAVPAIVLGAVTQDDATGIGHVVAAIATMSQPPVCFVGGPARLDPDRVPGAIALPSSLDAAVAAVVVATGPGKRRIAR